MNTVLNANMNESSNKLVKGFYPNTELGIDLKLITRKPGRLGIGEYLDGAITHDGEDHFTFVQNDSEKKKDKVVQRNPHVYEGTYINVNRKKRRNTLPYLQPSAVHGEVHLPGLLPSGFQGTLDYQRPGKRAAYKYEIGNLSNLSLS